MSNEKVEHVKRAGQTRDHECHWPGCGEQVPPAMWGCARHWYKLPEPIRSAIWRSYMIGQENGDADVSRKYLDAARNAQTWIQQYLKNGGKS